MRGGMVQYLNQPLHHVSKRQVGYVDILWPYLHCRVLENTTYEAEVM